ncbi:MAG: 50S ribosomal protein L32 [Dehalococcoidales bacterium]|jgi:large subunit ribosomal protein L32|nr:50S ribosomal protein L32 [Dehalococcoidales bacterium]
MTPLPKRKTPKAKQGQRRSHLALTPKALMNCPQCGSAKLQHHACTNCGTYAGKEAIEIKSPKKK